MNNDCVRKMCENYGINEEWIRTGKGEMMVSDYLDTAEREKLIKELQTILEKLTIEQLKRLVKYGKKLTHFGKIKKDSD